MTRELKFDLIFIARNLQEANAYILGEVSEEDTGLQVQPQYSSTDLEILKMCNGFLVPKQDDDFAPLLKWLEDTTVIPAWRKAFEKLQRLYGVELTGPNLSLCHRARSLCDEIILAHNRAAEMFDGIEDKLWFLSLETLCYSLREKFSALGRFSRFQLHNLDGGVYYVREKRHDIQSPPRQRKLAERKRYGLPKVRSCRILDSLYHSCL